MPNSSQISAQALNNTFLIAIGKALPSWCLPCGHSTKKYVLPFNQRRKLHDRAYRAQQRDHSEVCGLILADNEHRLNLFFLPNRSGETLHFEMDCNEIRATQRAARLSGKRVIGAFHSHPVGAAIPTLRDLRGAWLNKFLLIYDVCGREARMWRICKAGKRRLAKEVRVLVQPRQTKNDK